MLALLWLLVAAAIGSMFAYRFGGLRSLTPRWASALLIFGSGTAIGAGITSIVFFLCRLLLPGLPVLPMLIEIALAAGLGFEIYRTRSQAEITGPAKSGVWNAPLALLLIVVLGIGAVAMTSFWEANPQGNWDAWAIWNLRARFLASGGNLPVRAWSPLLSGHPEYPLLVPGFVARCWSYSGSTSPIAPAATGYVLFLALVAIGTGGIAALEGGSLGLLFGLALASSPFLLHEVPAQYSDIPLACFFGGTLVLMLLERPLAAGLLAGLASWTKDEGLLFLAVFLAAMAIARRRQFLWAFAGAIPAGALMLIFKLVLARGTASLLTRNVQGVGPGSKLMDPGRYVTVIAAGVEQLWNMSSAGFHPILPLIVLGLALKFKANWRRDVLPAGTVTAAMLVGYFFVYIVTPYDLDWHLQSSLNRLAVQLWPILLITLFAGLRAPEQLALEVPVDVPPAKDKKSRKRKA
jgi:hypothetical protein